MYFAQLQEFIIPFFIIEEHFLLFCHFSEYIANKYVILFWSVSAGESASEIFHDVATLSTIAAGVLDVLEHHVLYLIAFKAYNASITGELFCFLSHS